MKLEDPVSILPLVGPSYQRRLEKLEIETVEDLLSHVPHRYLDYRLRSDIAQVQKGEQVTVRGKIVEFKNTYTRRRKNFQLITLEDLTGQINAVWFNQPYLSRSFNEGDEISLSGKVDTFDNKPALISPYHEVVGNGPTIHTGRLVPIYPETEGVSSKWLRGRITYAYEKLKERMPEYLPQDLLKELELPELFNAYEMVHYPDDLDKTSVGKKRLAFNELLLLQLKSVSRKISWQQSVPSHKISIDKKIYQKFISSLPYELTGSQKRSVKEIFDDMAKDKPMNRLLEGDVGSGKTVVAAAAAFAAFVNGFQTVIMAPTQILAQQHYQTIGSLLEKFKVRVSLLTATDKKSDLGKTDIFIGTHALIHGYVDMQNVALVVIDEQHRFGVEQRSHLVKKSGSKSIVPHVLTMTATPIPRTVALTVYGDLDLSTIDELPKGRKPVTTWIVPPSKRNGAYEWIRNQIKEVGVQVFIVCPLIEESEKESMQQVKAATQEFEKLKLVFKEYKLSLLHGKLKAAEKNQILSEFKDQKTDIMVSTPVVEVGIDVPNANIMVVEASDRFGLSQLHQLRGRVGRGDRKSYCLLFTDNRTPKSQIRLKAMTKTLSGFELAELDLKLRGPGEVYGLKQHGFKELKIASWQDTELIRTAKRVANEVFEKPEKYQTLFSKLQIDKIIMN